MKTMVQNQNGTNDPPSTGAEVPFDPLPKDYCKTYPEARICRVPVIDDSPASPKDRTSIIDAVKEDVASVNKPSSRSKQLFNLAQRYGSEGKVRYQIEALNLAVGASVGEGAPNYHMMGKLIELLEQEGMSETALDAITNFVAVLENQQKRLEEQQSRIRSAQLHVLHLQLQTLRNQKMEGEAAQVEEQIRLLTKR
jgi:hypothetical protein